MDQQSAEAVFAVTQDPHLPLASLLALLRSFCVAGISSRTISGLQPAVRVGATRAHDRSTSVPLGRCTLFRCTQKSHCDCHSDVTSGFCIEHSRPKRRTPIARRTELGGQSVAKRVGDKGRVQVRGASRRPDPPFSPCLSWTFADWCHRVSGVCVRDHGISVRCTRVASCVPACYPCEAAIANDALRWGELGRPSSVHGSGQKVGRKSPLSNEKKNRSIFAKKAKLFHAKAQRAFKCGDGRRGREKKAGNRCLRLALCRWLSLKFWPSFSLLLR